MPAARLAVRLRKRRAVGLGERVAETTRAIATCELIASTHLKVKDHANAARGRPDVARLQHGRVVARLRGRGYYCSHDAVDVAGNCTITERALRISYCAGEPNWTYPEKVRAFSRNSQGLACRRLRGDFRQLYADVNARLPAGSSAVRQLLRQAGNHIICVRSTPGCSV